MKLKRILILSAVLIFMLAGSAVAAGDNPVSLDNSSVTDGQMGVPVDAQIELTFTNNVINASVAENNKECFKLLSGMQEVTIDVVMADDQIQPEMKRIITIVPKSPLESGRSYQLVISGELTAKNGLKLGQDISISFTTAGGSSPVLYIFGGAVVIAAVAVIIILVRRKNVKK